MTCALLGQSEDISSLKEKYITIIVKIKIKTFSGKKNYTSLSYIPIKNKNSNERDTRKRGHEMGNIYRLVEHNASHREQQRKSHNTKLDIGHIKRTP